RVTHHDFFFEQHLGLTRNDQIIKKTHREHRHFSRLHGPDDLEVGMEPPPGRLLAYRWGARHHVPIVVWLIDVGPPQGEHAIVQHAAPTAIEKTRWHTTLVVVAGRDAIQAIVREKRWPAFEVILINTANVVRHQPLHPAYEVVVLCHEASAPLQVHCGSVGFPKTPDRGLIAAPPLAFDAAPTHFEPRCLVCITRNRPLNEAADPAVFHGDETRRADEIAL